MRRSRKFGAGVPAICSGLVAVLMVGVGPAGAKDALGPKDPAKGSPITIGVITEGGSEAIGSQSDQTKQGAEIAVKYANEYLGGIAGHKIELFVCGNQATPAGGADCANQMVEKKVVAVVLPFSGQSAAQVPIVVGAGIPYVTGSGASSADLTTPGAFALSGGYPASLGAEALHAKENGYKKVGHIVIDVPAASGGAKALGGITFKNAGVDYEVITAAPGTPDLSPQLQAAVDGGADALAVTGDITFCTSFLQAYQTLALDVPKYVIATCVDPTIIKKLGSTLKNSFISTSATDDPKDPDRKVYAVIVKKYGKGKINPDPRISAGISSGVGIVLNFVRAMDGVTGEVDAAATLAQMKAAADVPHFLGGGSTFTCDGTAIPLVPNVCSGDIMMGTLNAKGLPTKLKAYNVAEVYKT